MNWKVKNAALAASLVLTFASCASAGTVTATFQSANPGAQTFNISYLKPGNVAANANNIRAGLMNWTQTSFTTGGNLVGNGNNFFAYCIDLAQTVNNNTFTVTLDPSLVPNPSTATGSLATAWAGDATKTKEAALLRLFAKHYAPSNTSGNFHAGFQLAVWEIIFETTAGNKSVSSGTMNATGVTAAINQANSFLSNLFSGGSYALGSFVYLTSGNNQDQVVYIPPPTPGPLPDIPLPTAALAGLALLSGMGLRRITRA